MKTTIVVHTPFTLRLEGDPVMSAHGLTGVIPFAPGEHEVEQAIADHWFVKHHADPKPPQRALNEVIAQQHADMMREQLAAVVTAAPQSLATEQPLVLETQDLPGLATAEAPVLSTEDVTAIESADVASLAAEQVQALATADVTALATEQSAAQSVSSAKPAQPQPRRPRK